MVSLESIRERLEAREEALSPFAARASRSLGRARPEPQHPYRTEFQRDRDRIIHTNSFRRLKHKSQVFLAPQGDHYVTRLTHTIEVQQIGRTIARALNLNEDLVEAIALGHDLGHTPFGHVGEGALDRLLPGGFHHSRHSVRIVERLEKGGRGLNLTREVVDGIRRHSKPRGAFLEPAAVEGMTLEAQIVRISDAIAYLTHDIGDALRAGVITLADLPRPALEALGERHSQRVDALVTDIIASSWPCSGLSPLSVVADGDTGRPASGANAPQSSPRGEEVQSPERGGAVLHPLSLKEALRPGSGQAGKGEGEPLTGASPREEAGKGDGEPVPHDPPVITMSPRLGRITTELREFMFDTVYMPLSESPEGRAAADIVALLFEHYRANPSAIPGELRGTGESVERIAADMVCGMTDQFAVRHAEQISPGISRGLFEGRL